LENESLRQQSAKSVLLLGPTGLVASVVVTWRLNIKVPARIQVFLISLRDFEGQISVVVFVPDGVVGPGGAGKARLEPEELFRNACLFAIGV
jgi:hypothetical protein